MLWEQGWLLMPVLEEHMDVSHMDVQAGGREHYPSWVRGCTRVLLLLSPPCLRAVFGCPAHTAYI